jgi:NAD dependent epimerase/dehydratase family enzyme
VRFAFGEMGEALLLEGAYVNPAKLLALGHRFSYPALEEALRHLLP